jgi:hypothetical protein
MLAGGGGRGGDSDMEYPAKPGTRVGLGGVVVWPAVSGWAPAHMFPHSLGSPRVVGRPRAASLAGVVLSAGRWSLSQPSRAPQGWVPMCPFRR